VDHATGEVDVLQIGSVEVHTAARAWGTYGGGHG
jgi:hypothetical protein